MAEMRTERTYTTVLRMLAALVFGFMGVVQMPMMAFAGTADSHPVRVSSPGTGHHHGATAPHHDDAPFSDQGDRTAPQTHDDAAICHSTACCAALAQPAMSAPPSALLLIGQLQAPVARIIVPVAPEPVVPPPRLQA